jgi:C-terminal processing protease CtpA/Prc
MPTLYADTMPGAVGYIYINQFVGTDIEGEIKLAEGTDKLFMKASNWLATVSKGTWILDLRGNGGGLVTSALNIAGSLVPPGAPLIQQQVRDSVVDATLEPIETHDTLVGASDMVSPLKGRTIILLQDRFSASSSEIVISALRENLGSSVVTIGDTSYGKGIGQIYSPTPLGGFMAITCLHLSPLKAPDYHGIGIAPDRLIDSAEISAQAWNLALGAKPAARGLGYAQRAWSLQALDWNRMEARSQVRSPLKPAAPWRPFPVR